MSTINPAGNVSQTVNGNVIQIQRIKLVPVNELAAGFHATATDSHCSSQQSPRNMMATRGQSSYRGSQNAIAANYNKSLFMNTGASNQAMMMQSRYHSTQRSTFIKGTVANDSECDPLAQTSLMNHTNVDKELPLKFKPFKKGPNKGEASQFSANNHIASIQSLKQAKFEAMKVN